MILDVGVGTTCPLFASIYSPLIDIYHTMPILSFIGGTSETHSIFARGAPDYFLCPLIVVRVSITLQKPVHPLILTVQGLTIHLWENSDFAEDERQPSTIHGYRNKPQTHLITLPPQHCILVLGVITPLQLLISIFMLRRWLCVTH